jgi:hypothetical protein
VNVSFRNAERRDALTIVPFLRERDRLNLLRQGNPAEVIQEAMSESISNYVGLAEEVPAVLWGLRAAQLLDNSAYIWMLGTSIIDDYPIHFLRFSRAAIKMMRQRYRVLYGEIETDYKASQRWLQWCGAEITPHERHLMFVLRDE